MEKAGEYIAILGIDDQQSQLNKTWINTSETNLLKLHWLVKIDSSYHQYICTSNCIFLSSFTPRMVMTAVFCL